MDHGLLEDLSDKVMQIANIASDGIMDIYQKHNIYTSNKKDGSDVTEADILSNALINEGLENLKLNIPILSEEDHKKEKQNEEVFWLVDPLDGTKEFLNKNGEFTVNIALVEKGRPVLGVITAPALKKAYYGILEKGSFKIESGVTKPLNAKKNSGHHARVAISRSHLGVKENNFIAKISESFQTVETLKVGSSLKLCMVAEGEADIYYRSGPTYQWDIASGQAIVEHSGGCVIDSDLKELSYSYEAEKKNPSFFCLGELTEAWKEVIINSSTI